MAPGNSWRRWRAGCIRSRKRDGSSLTPSASRPATLVGHLDDPVSADVVEAITAMTERRLAGEPLQYVLGAWSFRRLELRVDHRVLMPRPETEQVVEAALSELRRLVAEADRSGEPEEWRAVDLGTGSGAIALSLALEGPRGLEVWATDISVDALELARSNLTELVRTEAALSGRVRWAEGRWFDALPRELEGRLHLVVSNPPYVSADEWSALDPVVRDHEPVDALVAGPRGLEALETLVDQASVWLLPGGSLVLELAPSQAAPLAERAERAGYVEVRIRPDLADRPRMLVARRPR